MSPLQELNDGGSLVLFNNMSHVVYVKEEVDGFRVTIDGRTIVFQKENDPTVIRATSPGKLVRFLGMCGWVWFDV